MDRPASRGRTSQTGRRFAPVGSSRPSSRLSNWVSQHGLAVASIVGGGFVYALARLWYVAFYGEFGLDPEDVGLGSSATLARAIPGFLVVAIPVSLVAVFYYLVARVIGVFGSRENRTRTDVLGLLVGVVALLILVTVPNFALDQASDVKEGHEIRATGHRLSIASFRNLLGLNVRQVDIGWRDKTRRPLKLGKDELMLLGSGSDLYYIYDVELGRTVSLPRDLVVIYEQD